MKRLNKDLQKMTEHLNELTLYEKKYAKQLIKKFGYSKQKAREWAKEDIAAMEEVIEAYPRIKFIRK